MHPGAFSPEHEPVPQHSTAQPVPPPAITSCPQLVEPVQ